jgi:hypothetical protein
MADRCFACDRRLGQSSVLVEAEDDQTVYVGRDCARKIEAAGEYGYQPPKGGPRLYTLKGCDCQNPVGSVRLISNDCPHHG